VRPVNVLDELSGFVGEGEAAARLDDHEQDAAWLAWCAIVKRMKPGQEHAPLTPPEVERALEIVNALHYAIVTARARNPNRLRPVPGDAT
jgi:hypothetical protein